MPVAPQPSPLVSVVMSVFNDAQHLPRSVESIRQQSYENWELVIIDDGSTDDTPEQLASFADADQRIRVISQENSGLTRALIRGCSEARGGLIARLDSDDWSHPERLTQQVAFLDKHPDVGFVSCWTQYVGPNDEPLEILRRPVDSAEATRRLLNERLGPPAHGSVMFRRQAYEAAGGYRAEFYFGQDSDLWMRMAEQTQIGYVQAGLYTALRCPFSISGARLSAQQRFGELGQACRRARKTGESEAPFLTEAAALTAAIRERRNAVSGNSHDVSSMEYLIGSQLAVNRDRRASTYLWNVIRHRPWHWKAWVRLAQSITTGVRIDK